MRGTFMQMYIVLGLLVFMVAMFFTHKVPYGVTTMTCCVMLRPGPKPTVATVTTADVGVIIITNPLRNTPSTFRTTGISLLIIYISRTIVPTPRHAIVWTVWPVGRWERLGIWANCLPHANCPQRWTCRTVTTGMTFLGCIL